MNRKINAERLTMYIANRRNSSKFSGCSPLQIHLGLIGLKPAIAYLPYTHRCMQFKTSNNEISYFYHSFDCLG